MRSLTLLACIGILLAPQIVSADSRPASLDQAQRVALLHVTCDAHGTSADAEINAWRVRGKQGFAATAICPALPRVRSLPGLRSYTCESATGTAWTCAAPLNAVRIEVNTRPILISWQKGRMSGALAMAITRYMGEQHPLTFNGYNLREMMIEGRCLVAPAGAGALSGSANYLLHCGPNQLTVGRQCVETRCRMFPVAYRVEAP